LHQTGSYESVKLHTTMLHVMLSAAKNPSLVGGPTNPIRTETRRSPRACQASAPSTQASHPCPYYATYPLEG